MNRTLRRDRGSMEVGVVDLFVSVAIGSSGAPTLDTTNSKGIASITRNGTGDYTVTLQDSVNRLLQATCVFDTTGASGAVPAAPIMAVKAQSVTSAKTVRLLFADVAGAAADPAEGEVVLVHLILKNSSVN